MMKMSEETSGAKYYFLLSSPACQYCYLNESHYHMFDGRGNMQITTLTVEEYEKYYGVNSGMS